MVFEKRRDVVGRDDRILDNAARVKLIVRERVADRTAREQRRRDRFCREIAF